MNPAEAEKISAAYRKERKRLLGYINYRVSDRMEAEDILQEVFYQLTAGFNDIRRIESLTSWLYRVANNMITDKFRKKKTATLSYDEKSSETEDGYLTLKDILPEKAPLPADNDLREMIWDTIEETLAELPEEQSYVFIQNEFEEMSFKKISDKTGIGINTLISRKRYAVLALRKRLNELYKLYIYP
ncbi:MAG TPA: RNA polymerase sigma factor [Bacteroidales bacterium]|nr:RNA polymerase sigma factor [Bacteroidales bacterium]